MLLLAPTSDEEEARLSDEIPVDSAANKAVHKFRVACHAAAPIRLRVTGPGLDEPLEFSFASPFVIIGRSRRADLRLQHPDVSLRHTYLQMVRGRMYCVDLESRTGISHQSDRRRGELIDEGEAIHIGPYHVHVINWSSWDEIETFDASADESSDDKSNSDEYEGTTSHADDSTDTYIRANVEVLNGKKTGRRFHAVEEEITLVGNAPGSHLRLKDSSMSKTHCALVRTAEALWCVDLLGRGGTRLNGAEIRIGRLYDGDLLHVGRAKLKIHYSNMENQPPIEPSEQPRAAAETSDASQPADEGTMPAPAASSPQVADMAGELSQLIAQNLANITPPAGAQPPIPFSPPVPAMAPNPQLPAAQTEGERNVSEAFVLSLVNQFGQMQQQMFQQSQQSMMMLVNMFSSLHQNHMELIRDDLNRIHQITDELKAVQSQMADGQTSATSVSYTRDSQPAGDSQEHVQDAEISEPRPATPEPRTAPPPSSSESPQPGPGETPPTVPADAADRPRSDRSGVRAHTLLSERLAELENERNSRWQKIMKTITGMGGA